MLKGLKNLMRFVRICYNNKNSKEKKDVKFILTSSTILCEDPSLPGASLCRSSLSSTSANFCPASSCKKAWNNK